MQTCTAFGKHSCRTVRVILSVYVILSESEKSHNIMGRFAKAQRDNECHSERSEESQNGTLRKPSRYALGQRDKTVILNAVKNLKNYCQVTQRANGFSA